MGELIQHEICQIYAGLKHSFAVSRQGKIFCWGSNENNLLGLNFNNQNSSKNDDNKVWEPTELELSNVAPEFFSDPQYK